MSRDNDNSRNQLVASLRTSRWRALKTEKLLYTFLFPAIIVTLLFRYLPMFSNVIAFMDYDFGAGWLGLGSPFVGLKHFIHMTRDPYFYSLAIRTLFYSSIRILFGHPAPFILAILINELRNKIFKRTVQTIFYLPHFVSWVTFASLAYWFLSSDTSGIINNLLEFIGFERIIFMKYPVYFPGVLVITGIIKETGWGTIIYLAAISAVDPQLYEAATIDGAGRWKKFVYVTFPSILPTTVILLIFSFGSLFSTNFDQIFNLQNPIIQSATNTINVYTYYAGVKGGQYSVSTAIGLAQGLINAFFMLSVNWISKRVTQYGFF